MNISGQMAEFIKDNGKKTNFMAEEYTHGLMGEFTMVITRMTRNMAMACTRGQMANATTEAGSMESNMVKQGLLILKAAAK